MWKGGGGGQFLKRKRSHKSESGEEYSKGTQLLNTTLAT